MPHELTVGILNYNTADETLAALRTLPEALADVEARVIVLDNASSDDSVARIKAGAPHVELVAFPANLGFAAAFNRLFSYAVTPYYLLMNSDILLPGGCVRHMLDYLTAHPDIGLAGPALYREDGSPQTSYGDFPSLGSELLNRSLWRRLRQRGGQQAGPFTVDAVIGAVMLLPRTTIEEIGGLDERFFFFLEETDWCRRIADAGQRVVHFPDIHVTHLQGRAANKLPVRARIEFQRSRLLYFGKHHGEFARSLLYTGALVRALVNALAQLVALILTLGLVRKVRRRLVLYTAILVWYLAGCPASWGLSGVRSQHTREQE
jgi:GT2 family glycosyltransferase